MTPKLHVLYTVLSCAPGRRHTILPSPPVLMKTKVCTPVLRGTTEFVSWPFSSRLPSYCSHCYFTSEPVVTGSGLEYWGDRGSAGTLTALEPQMDRK